MSGCTTAAGARASLVRVADHFSFAPSDGALVVSGTVAPDGSFNGALVTNPARHDQPGHPGTAAPPFTLTVTGRLDDEAASGTYVTPRCSTAFRLPRIGATVLP
jgi:hypothetical protein